MSRFLISWAGRWASEITDDADHAAEMAKRGAEVTELAQLISANDVGAGGVIAPKAKDDQS